MASDLTKKSLSTSMIVGTLLVPLTAVAAVWLTGQEQSAAEAPITNTTTSVSVVAVSDPTVVNSPVDPAADLEMACGSDGMQLVSLEESGKITDVQQAALDALRDICDQEGLPLPSRPAPDPIVQTVVIPAATATTVAGSTSTSPPDEDQYEDDEYEGEDDGHEEDGHEEDGHEDEHEHEDED